MPAEGYPFAWSVYTWLKGESATVARITDPAQLATDLANAVLVEEARRWIAEVLAEATL
jgi:hypothetical protein